MGFKIDGSNVGGFPELPVGEYEVIFAECEAKQSSTGNPMIAAKLTIRDDVDQKGHGRNIFDYLVASEAAMFKINSVGKLLGLDGIEFDSIGDFAKVIHGRCIRIKTKNEPYTNQAGETTNSPKVAYYMASKVEAREIAVPAGHDPFADDGRPIDINEDVLPF